MINNQLNDQIVRSSINFFRGGKGGLDAPKIFIVRSRTESYTGGTFCSLRSEESYFIISKYSQKQR